MPPINYKDIKKKNTLPLVNNGMGSATSTGLNTNPLATATPTSNLPPISPALKTGSNQPGGSTSTNMIESMFSTPPPAGTNVIPDANINNMNNLQIASTGINTDFSTPIAAKTGATQDNGDGGWFSNLEINAEQKAAEADKVIADQAIADQAAFQASEAEKAAAQAEANKILPPVSGQTQVPGYQTTDIGEQALDQYSQYALGEDPQVAAERERLDRNSVLQVEQAKREAHQFAVQQGFQPGSPQYEQIMRDRTSNARNTNISATNAFQDFMRGRRSDQQQELLGLSDTEFGKIGTQQARDDQAFNNLVKFLPSDKAQQMLAVSRESGLDLGAAMQNMYDENGNLKPEYQDKSTPELIKSGIQQSFDQMNTNPDTGEAWREGEKEAMVDKFYSDNFRNILYPSETQTEQIEEKSGIDTRVDAFMESGDASGMLDSDWSSMSPTQLSQAVSDGYIDKFENTQTYLRSGDFINSGLKADTVTESVDDRTWDQDNAAGKGNGSLIVYNGTPMRITRYDTKKDTTGTNERIGRVYATPLGGGDEIEISSTGWKDI